MRENGGASKDDDSDSDDGSGSGDLDVLGMEDPEDSGSSDSGAEQKEKEGEGFRDYMTELDEQLEGLIDTAPQEEESGKGKLPLSSHHVKVHNTGPLELDMHAMEHVLASFCNEHQLEAGPASLLLGELGLGGVKGISRSGDVSGGYPSLSS